MIHIFTLDIDEITVFVVILFAFKHMGFKISENNRLSFRFIYNAKRNKKRKYDYMCIVIYGENVEIGFTNLTSHNVMFNVYVYKCASKTTNTFTSMHRIPHSYTKTYRP